MHFRYFIPVLICIIFGWACSDSQLGHQQLSGGQPSALEVFSFQNNIKTTGRAKSELLALPFPQCDYNLPVQLDQPIIAGVESTAHFPSVVIGPALIGVADTSSLNQPPDLNDFALSSIAISASGSEGVYSATANNPASLSIFFAGAYTFPGGPTIIWCSNIFDVVVLPNPENGIEGEMVAWYPLQISFDGPSANESDIAPNPFLDYRLVVDFTGPSGQFYRIPGFFNGDGNGGGQGSKWSVRFAPDEGGAWSALAHFHTGPQISLDTNLSNGVEASFHGQTVNFQIANRDPNAPGFYKYGMLNYVGGHYLKFQDGPYFIKGGTDSPENLLGYKGFDNTFDQPGGASTSGLEDGLHRYLPHNGDFGSGGLGDSDDPYFASADWPGYDSKGLIGALNYLSSKNVNSIYFLPMNLGGDGRDTYPWIGPFDKVNYDISKLDQWNQVFEHATKHGILLHFVLAETENENEDYLDGGYLGTERKLFYRELIARFGHALALKWNLSEENDFSQTLLEQFSDYINSWDAYDHYLAFHTHTITSQGGWYGPYDDVLGDPRFTATSIQSECQYAGDHVEKWRADSASSGHKWIVEHDEQNGGLTDTNIDNKRKECLYDILFGGGHVEWYFGYFSLPLGGDMRTEDFRTRDEMWDYMWYARKFMEENLPFWQMDPHDELVTGENSSFGGAEVFAKLGDVYAVYFPNASATGQIDLTDASTSTFFNLRWYNPRTGIFNGDISTLQGGGVRNIGAPPHSSSGDWVAFID